MRHGRRSLRLSLLLAAALACFAALVSSASAEYGGLGKLGTIGVGEEPNHVEATIEHPHGFVVNPTDGSFYIADQTKTAIRVQKFAENGAFVAEGHIPLPPEIGASVGGLAIDPVQERVYLLVNAPRPSLRPEAVVQQLEQEIEALNNKAAAKETTRGADETKAAKYKKEIEENKPNKAELEQKLKETDEKIATLTGEIKKLEAEVTTKEEDELPFDAEVPAAYELLAFSTKNSGTALPLATGTGVTNGVVSEEKELTPFFENEHEDPAPLLEPRGIAVDPATHDVIILGQQDVAAPPPRGGAEPVNFRAAAQRIHATSAEKRIGPRYLDSENCLEGGGAVAHEPKCGEFEAAVTSPIVVPSTAGGRLLAVREGGQGEVWELPAITNDTEAFPSTFSAKRYPVKPKQVFELPDARELVTFGGLGSESEQGDTMAFASTGTGQGRIALTAKVSELANSSGRFGALLLSYEESGQPQFSVLGWTGGANVTSQKPDCTVPAGESSPVLVGAVANERTLLFNTLQKSNEEEASANVLAFGPGGEGCGSAEGTSLKVEVGGKATETVKAGTQATIVGAINGADAQSTKWTIENVKTGAKETETTSGFQEQPELAHVFGESGRFKITAVVTPDDFQPALPPETAEVTVEGAALGFTLSAPVSVEVGKAAHFTAHTTDPFPHGLLKYTWSYGDGTPEVQKEAGLEALAEHVYASPASYNVKVTVSDGTHKAETSATVKVTAPTSGPPPPPPPPPSNSGTSTQTGSGGVLPFVEARLASSSVTVKASGALTLSVSCKTGDEACAGTVTLKTLKAVAAGHGKKKHILQLATGSFNLAAGRSEIIALHLSSAGRALLARTHTLRVSATVLARSPLGKTQQTQTVLTLKLAKKKKKH